MRIGAMYKSTLKMYFKSCVILLIVLAALTAFGVIGTRIANSLTADKFSAEGVAELNATSDGVTYTLVNDDTIMCTSDSDGDSFVISRDIQDSNLSGLESTIYIFLFVTGILFFRSILYIGFSNGISRKTSFWSTLLVGATYSVALLLGLYILYCISGLIFGVSCETMIVQCYGVQYKTLTAGNLLMTFVFDFINCFVSFVSGLFIGGLYYRMNKTLKIIVSVGVPVSLFIILPIFVGYMSVASPAFNEFITATATKIAEILSTPFTSTLGMMAQTAVFIVLSFLLIRKAPIKENAQ